MDNKIPTDTPAPEPDAPKTWQDLLLPESAVDTPAEGSEAGPESDSEQPEDLDEALSGVAGAPVAPPLNVVDRFKDQLKGAGKG